MRKVCRESCLRPAKRDEMIDEKELTKRLMASVEVEMRIPPYQMGVANLIVRHALLGRFSRIIKEGKWRTARRKHAVEIQKNGG